MDSALKEPLTNAAPTLFLLLVGTVCAEWNALAKELTRVRDLAADLVRQDERGRVMEERQTYLLAAARVKEGIVREFLARRLTLLEAAARFYDVNSQAPGNGEWLRQIHAASSDEERACREVIHWTCAELLHHGRAEAAAMEACLTRELEEHLNSFGTIRLPASR